VVERLPQVQESLVVGVELPDGGYWMPLFVKLAEGAADDDALRAAVTTALRTELSPRHVPDEVVVVPGMHPHAAHDPRVRPDEIPLERRAPLRRPFFPVDLRENAARIRDRLEGPPVGARGQASVTDHSPEE